MNGAFESTNSEALIKVYGGIKHTEISEEFILPDYLPDVKKIIRADAYPKIEGKYVSQGKIEYDGEAVIRLLFIDEKNQLHSVSFDSSFSDSLEIESVSSECIANLLPSPESLSCRTVNPRRISVRLRIDTDITVRCMCSFRPELSGASSETEVLSEELSVLKLICGDESDLSCAADLEADGALPQIGEVIACDIDMCFYECKGSEGRVLCRGDMPITVFYSSPTEGGEIYTVLFRKLPLAQVVAAEGVDESYECTARGTINDVKINVAENGFGERRILELDISYRMAINCIGNENVTITKDIYSCNDDVRAETETVTFNRFIRNYSAAFTANYISDSDDAAIDGADGVLAVFAHPRTESVILDPKAKRLIVEGSCDTGAMLQRADELTCAEHSVPFHLELEATGVPEEFTYTCDTVCLSARGRIDGGKLYTDIELQIALTVLATERREIIRSASFTPRAADKNGRPSQLRFFYPEHGETLWNIGKQFGVSCEKLKEVNRLTDREAIPDVLIIPKS